jgi:hypothetical protein
MPMVLVNFSKTLKGKFLLLVLTIVITLYNKTGGLLMAMLLIFLSEFNYEFNSGILYEGFKTSETDDDDEDTDTEETDTKEREKKIPRDQLTIAEKIKAKPS